MKNEMKIFESLEFGRIRTVNDEKGEPWFCGAPDKPCGVGRADANPKLLLNDT